MAESTGLEPVERKPVHGLAIRCITTLPTFHRGTELYVYYLSPSVNIFFKLSAFLSKKLSPGPSPLLDFFHSSAITDNRRHYYKFQNYFL